MPDYLVGSDKAYNTVQAAFNAISTNLAGTGIHNVIIDPGFYDYSVLTKTNGSSADYVNVSGASSHYGLFTSGARLDGIAINSAYTRMNDIVVDTAQTQSVEILTSNCRFENVLARIDGTRCFFLDSGATSCHFYKCLGVNLTGGVRHGWRIEAAGCQLINCGAYTNVRGFSTTMGGVSAPTAKNCWAFQGTGSAFDGTFTSGSSNNASSDSTAPGSSATFNLTTSAVMFSSIADFNFHIDWSSILNGIGSDQSAYFTTDFDGNVITSWPIGPDFPQFYLIAFVSNISKGTIPFYFRLTDVSILSAYTSENDYQRIWSITNLRTSAIEYFESTSASVEYCISANSLLNDLYTISLSAVIL